MLFRQCLEARKTSLGETHPDTLITINYLSLVLYNQDKCAEAEKLLRECVEKTEKVLGKDHPDTLNAKKGLEILQEELNSVRMFG
eukprot:4429418-Ditylum_brightwellii.AAC.1